MCTIYDCRQREITGLIVYAVSIKERIADGKIEEDFHRFSKGHRPKNGKYYLPEEFFILQCGDRKIAESTNMRYEGAQTIDVGDDKYILWYYPIERLNRFNRIDTKSSSPDIINKILENKDFDCIFTQEVQSVDVRFYYNKKRNLLIRTISKSCSAISAEYIYVLEDGWHIETYPALPFIKEEYRKFDIDTIKMIAKATSYLLDQRFFHYRALCKSIRHNLEKTLL